MRILFIRHGDPNYTDDCLTPLGHVQAKAAAERVKNEGISRIYSSSCGRAYETALYAAELLQLPVEQLDFMRELSWGWADEAAGKRAHPWECAKEILCAEGVDPMRTEAWREHRYFVNSDPLTTLVDAAVDGFDAKNDWEEIEETTRASRTANFAQAAQVGEKKALASALSPSTFVPAVDFVASPTAVSMLAPNR